MPTGTVKNATRTENEKKNTKEGDVERDQSTCQQTLEEAHHEGTDRWGRCRGLRRIQRRNLAGNFIDRNSFSSNGARTSSLGNHRQLHLVRLGVPGIPAHIPGSGHQRMDEIPDHCSIADGRGNNSSNETQRMDLAKGHMDGPAKNQRLATDWTQNQTIASDMASRRHCAR